MQYLDWMRSVARPYQSPCSGVSPLATAFTWRTTGGASDVQPIKEAKHGRLLHSKRLGDTVMKRCMEPGKQMDQRSASEQYNEDFPSDEALRQIKAENPDKPGIIVDDIRDRIAEHDGGENRSR